MRLIFSRKGFDSEFGGCASPILPDGRMYSLPIPSHEDSVRLGDVRPDGFDLAALAADLSGGRVGTETTVHLDPDLDHSSVARLPGWRPAFGQTGAAQTHLANQGVAPGDLFLFFGWFREVEFSGGRWRFKYGAPDIHAIFGWLRVQDVFAIGADSTAAINRFPFLAPHPHIASAKRCDAANNTIYLGNRARMPSDGLDMAGAGTFPSFSRQLQLTAQGRSRSWWSFPGCFHPDAGKASLSYHAAPGRWQRTGDSVLLESVGKGQEFVLDISDRPGVGDWLHSIFASACR